jgi:hypothetical protein
MRFAYDWRRILMRAWSLRLNAIAFVFGSAELVLPLFANEFPRHVFAVLSIAALAGSMVARLIRQKGYYRDD